MEITWPESDVKKLIELTKTSFTHEDMEHLERCVRNGTGSEYFQNSDFSDSKKYLSSDFKRNEGDIVGQCVDQLWSSYAQLSLFLSDVIESSSILYKNIVSKGLENGLPLSSGSDTKMAYLTWKNSLYKHLQKYIIVQLRKESLKKSSEGCFFSIGNQYNNFDGETINNLINCGFATVNSFIGLNSEITYRELEFLEYNGLFNKIDKSSNSFYQDCLMMWLKSSYFEDDKHKNTSEIVRKLSEIPYEITYKCKIFLQVVTSVCVTCMEAHKSVILEHSDGSDNGVKYTCLYIPKSVSDSSIKINLEGNSQKIDSKDDQLIILRSDVKYEIKKLSQKFFLFTCWLTGPS